MIKSYYLVKNEAQASSIAKGIEMREVDEG